jgi:hypothetical protein
MDELLRLSRAGLPEHPLTASGYDAGQSQEVWAAGVTYLSKEARMEVEFSASA